MITAQKQKERKRGMNFQTLIFSLLSCLVLFLAFLIILVVFCGVLRIAIISVFEYDFVQAYKSRKALKQGIKTVNEVRKEKGLDPLDDLPRVYKMGLYKGKDNEDI